MVMSGCAALSVSSCLRTPEATSVSPAPRVRTISKPTTRLPLSSAAERCSATVSRTVATWSRRMWRPSLSATSMRASSRADCTVPMVRTDCSAPPTSVRPPEASRCVCRSWREMSAAVASSACRRAGSSSTQTCRVTPPTRLTEPTPRTASRLRVTWSSTNQDSASSSMRLEATVKVRIGEPASSTFETIGSRRSVGRSERTRETASRTSSSASCVAFSRRNSTVVIELPSCTVV